MKLEIYSKGTDAPVATHYIKDDIQETKTGQFIQFMSITGKRIITNMDFVIIEEENQS